MQDKKTLHRINVLLRDILRNSYDGIGKPEPLRYCDGYWSRRIDSKNRLVYSVNETGDVTVILCKGHYED
ncbi:MAG: Txe/YoeB family addiction module toxin [Clostridiales bacterium]|nr:Txe/YoeB family addiction module toxin [Clostridiales bacterium]